eukprot:SAG11_NODE_479_length_9108_cov_3.699856_1_plen_146_part_10
MQTQVDAWIERLEEAQAAEWMQEKAVDEMEEKLHLLELKEEEARLQEEDWLPKEEQKEDWLRLLAGFGSAPACPGAATGTAAVGAHSAAKTGVGSATAGDTGGVAAESARSAAAGTSVVRVHSAATAGVGGASEDGGGERAAAGSA